ncbi:MAG: cell division protein FtsB [Candidatus Parabeggiatoa sp. nov. 2]|nr:MAG: cell division protein FtsB [Beggiatoa sp. 4572_84]RKZ52187.1 MAG: cell division protein FtsB [Gammaproteobacteria bacterium]
MKILIVILSLLLINLQYHFWIGKGSYQEYNSLKKMIEQQQQKNAVLKIRNDALVAEVADLKSGLEAIEERARLELGMIKRGEVFYQIVE